MQLLEGLKIIEAVTATLHKGNEHYIEQLKVMEIPGVDEALGIMSANCNADISSLRMGMQMGVYLHIRQQETERLEKLTGGI